MKSPVDLMSDFIVAPLTKIKRYFQGHNPVQSGCGKVANFIFKYSKETALIMLFCNFIATLSSHNSQIRGLKKGDRENKDYLIDLEKKERLLDSVLNIIPPFMMNNFLKKKLEGGTWTTETARKKLMYEIAPDGFSRDDLYSIEHIRPVRETILENFSKLLEKVGNNSRHIPAPVLVRIRRFNDIIKKGFPDPVTRNYRATLEDITTDFDDRIEALKIKDATLAKLNLRNNSAYDELSGMNNGLLVLTTIAYMIVASNIIMPILKHKLAKSAAKKMEKKNQNIQKPTYNYTQAAINKHSQNSIFRDFNGVSYTIPRKPVINHSPVFTDMTI